MNKSTVLTPVCLNVICGIYNCPHYPNLSKTTVNIYWQIPPCRIDMAHSYCAVFKANGGHCGECGIVVCQQNYLLDNKMTQAAEEGEEP
jgi:hypothetical protein